ncbi:MAG: hypothetical protein JWL97_3904 [Gemmatimonadales bacterium]|nr:hypothetical protein [Gemmatimonadales bacterium]
MGAKTWMLAIVDGNVNEILKSRPTVDRAASEALARQLFASEMLEPLPDTDLSFTCPPDGEICIGCFPGVTIVAAKEFAIDYPSRLLPRFLEFAGGSTVYLHAMHSVVDWFAYAVWQNGTLQRSLSLSPDSGIIEDIGTRRSFEEPYWSGAHPATDPDDEDDGYPFPFHPLELGEAALLDLFGYQLEGYIDPNNLQPEEIALMRFKRAKARWKLW